MRSRLLSTFVVILNLVLMLQAIVAYEDKTNLPLSSNSFDKSAQSHDYNNLDTKVKDVSEKEKVSSEIFHSPELESNERHLESKTRKGKQFMAMFPR